jgi:hypothetical protein
MLASSWIIVQLAASQEGLSSMSDEIVVVRFYIYSRDYEEWALVSFGMWRHVACWWFTYVSKKLIAAILRPVE